MSPQLDDHETMYVAGKRRTEYATTAPRLEACPSGSGAFDWRASSMTEHRVVEISAATALSSDDLIQQARDRLDIYGGISTSVGRDDDLKVTISFDPRTATGGVAAIFEWLDSLEVEYEARFSKWFD